MLAGSSALCGLRSGLSSTQRRPRRYEYIHRAHLSALQLSPRNKRLAVGSRCTWARTIWSRRWAQSFYPLSSAARAQTRRPTTTRSSSTFERSICINGTIPSSQTQSQYLMSPSQLRQHTAAGEIPVDGVIFANNRRCSDLQVATLEDSSGCTKQPTTGPARQRRSVSTLRRRASSEVGGGPSWARSDL